MKRSALARQAGACLVLLLAGAPARAEVITWSERTFGTPTTVFADEGHTSGVDLKSHSFPKTWDDSQHIKLANLRAFSNAGPNSPATFTHQPFSVILFIKDQATGVGGAVTFTGYLDGTLSKNGADLAVTWTSPLTEHLHLGHNIYDITIDPNKDVVLPGGPGQKGSLSAQVDVHPNPEPSSFLLAALALPALGWAARRRRRAAKAQAHEEPLVAT
jgi:hypothetical protein